MRTPRASALAVVLLGAACVVRQPPAELDLPPGEPAAEPASTPAPAAPTVASEPTPEADPEPAATAPDPGPPPLRYGPVPEGHRLLVPVSQERPMLNDLSWTPHSDRPVLLIEWGDCLAVDIRTGVIVAQLEGEQFRACDRWWDADELARGTPYASADQALSVDSQGDALSITDSGGQLLHALDADGAFFIAHHFAPVDHQIAAVAWDSMGVTRQAPLRLIIWDADTGKRLAAHKLAVPGEPMDLALFWNERGVVVLAQHDLVRSEDDWEAPSSAISSFFLKNKSSKIQRRLQLAYDLSLDPRRTDAQGRWLLSFQETFDDEERYRGRLRAISLTDLGNGLDWRWSGSTEDDGEQSGSMDFRDEWTGRWRADASTQWLETSIDHSGAGSKVALEMSWKAITAEPTPSIDGRRIYAGKKLDEAKLAPKLQLLGAGSNGPLLDWGLNQAAEQPEKTRLALGGCEPIDAAPQLDRVLAVCRGRRMALVDLADGSIELELDVGSYAEVVWGRSGWLALADVSGKLLVVDLASKQLTVERSDINRLAKLALGRSLDRLGVIVGDRLELLDATNGKRIIELPKPAGQVALHPDGRQLALIADAKVQVFALDSGELLASWPEPEFKDLAWRQDGAALLVGADVPKKMVDPSSGELLATLADWGVMSSDAIDPSWRWVRLRGDQILRTLDGMTISYGPTWVRLDSGLYEGDVDLRKPPFADLLWRTDENTFAIPKLTNKTVNPWVEREGLLAAFFAGETIAPPSVPIGKLPGR